MNWKIYPILLALVCAGATPAAAGMLDETRFCGPPARDARGQILRRADVLAAFKRQHACYSTGLNTGPCPGWIMDHVIPLACGGCDSVTNLQWLSVESWRAKSLFERKIYGGQGISPGCP